MGKFKRQYNTLNGTNRPKPQPIVTNGNWGHKELPPETPEQKFKRLRACAMIMAKRFGIRDWHRSYLTPMEIDAIEEERRACVQ
jgi:hypothetical protein